jgi:hypothetical protein
MQRGNFMCETKHSVIKCGFILCTALFMGALTGCGTYEERPRAQGMYPPPPHVVEHTYVEIHHESDFYKPLTPYGEWVTVESYGRCWRPARVDHHWRPYSHGHWVRTDAGWYWESDEPWGWATYHYGRWDWNPRYGWIWIPQTQWAPAWVSWRRGEGYVGWAPLPPSARFSGRGYFEVQDTHIQPAAFVFVQERRFLEPVRPSTVTVNNTIVNKTVNITNIKVENNIVINEGPRTEVIEKVSGQKVKPVSYHQLRKQEVEVFKKNYHEKGVYKEVGPYKKEGTPAPVPYHIAQPASVGPKKPGPKKEVYETPKSGPQPVWSEKEKPSPKQKGYETDVHVTPQGPVPVQSAPYKKGPPVYNPPYVEPQGAPTYGPKGPGSKKDVYEVPKQGPKPVWSAEEKYSPKQKGYEIQGPKANPVHAQPQTGYSPASQTSVEQQAGQSKEKQQKKGKKNQVSNEQDEVQYSEQDGHGSGKKNHKK